MMRGGFCIPGRATAELPAADIHKKGLDSVFVKTVIAGILSTRQTAAALCSKNSRHLCSLYTLCAPERCPFPPGTYQADLFVLKKSVLTNLSYENVQQVNRRVV